VNFSTAGADDDLRAAYLERQIDAGQKRGDELMAGARAIMRMHPSRQGRARAEQAARQALASYASVLNWAEDTDNEDKAHRQLDEAGHWVRHTFGCHLHRQGETYSQRCPVALGHNRLGMSVGGAARRICSLCGQDLSECEHMRGTAYLVPGGPAELGWCRVCLKESDCDHSPDEDYRVSVVSRIIEMELVEVSIVGKPAHPDARFTFVGVDIADLRDQLGADFAPGMPVNCDRCLSPCHGLTRHDMMHI
jgi:hypothetical protein